MVRYLQTFQILCPVLAIRLAYMRHVMMLSSYALHWRHNGHDSVSNHQLHDCLLSRLYRRRSKKISKLCVIGLCVGNSPETGKFPAQMASNAENVSIWWRHHVKTQKVSLEFTILDVTKYGPQLISLDNMFARFYDALSHIPKIMYMN